MIIKSLSRKAGTGQLFKYIFRYIHKEEKKPGLAKKGKAKESLPEKAHFISRHNVRSKTVDGYVKEFKQNETLRIHKRKDSVQVYHTILSFSNKDKEHINNTVLKDMAQKYVELRGINNLYVITSHHDKDHIHLHVAMSGTQINGLSSRISRQKFSDIKIALDLYQKEKYPQLVHSLPRHGRSKSKELSKEDLQKIYKNERRSDKQSILQVLETTFANASSSEQFFESMKQMGHIPYYRSGILTGIQYNGRKFRLGRLGYGESKIKELDTKKKRGEDLLQEIRSIRKLRRGNIEQGKEQNERSRLLDIENSASTSLQQDSLFEHDQEGIEAD